MPSLGFVPAQAGWCLGATTFSYNLGTRLINFLSVEVLEIADCSCHANHLIIK